MNKELKTCPFCGGQAELKVSLVFDSFKRVYVKCKQCGSNGKTLNTGKTVAFKGKPSRDVSLKEAVDGAVEAWNYRTIYNAESPAAGTDRGLG